MEDWRVVYSEHQKAVQKAGLSAVSTEQRWAAQTAAHLAHPPAALKVDHWADSRDKRRGGSLAVMWAVARAGCWAVWRAAPWVC